MNARLGPLVLASILMVTGFLLAGGSWTPAATSQTPAPPEAAAQDQVRDPAVEGCKDVDRTGDHPAAAATPAAS